MGVMSVAYTTINGEIVSEKRNGVPSDYIPDALGSTIALLSDTHQITDSWTYWPNGQVRTRTGTNPTPFTFGGTVGYHSDLVDNFTYVRARELRVALSRWQIVDALWPLEHAYGYARCSPTTWIDASGLDSCLQAALGWVNAIGGQPGGSRSSAFRQCQSMLQKQELLRQRIGATQCPGGAQEICQACSQASGLPMCCNMGSSSSGSGGGTGPGGGFGLGLFGGWETTSFGYASNALPKCIAACASLLAGNRTLCAKLCTLGLSENGCDALFNACGKMPDPENMNCMQFFLVSCFGN